jgi:type VI secretion system secreted protein Hcp
MRRRSAIGLFLAVMVAAPLCTPSSAMAAVDTFLKIGDIKGEVVDIGHKDEIEILSWSWGASTGTARTKKGLLPAACIQDLALMKSIDSSTPPLILNSVTGEVAPEAVLTMRKAGESPLEFLILRMTNVTVASYQISASSELPTESFVLHFESIKGEYRRQKEDGSAEAPIFFEVGGGRCPN